MLYKTLAVASVIVTLGIVIGVGGSMSLSDDDDTEAISSASGPPTSHGESLAFANGVVEGASRKVDLRFETSGRVAAIPVSEGQHVQVGEILARIDASTLESELAQAEASLARARAERERLINGTRQESRDIAHAEVIAAKARAEQARKTYERAVQLEAGQVIPQQEFDDTKAAFDIAQADLAAAQARDAEADAKAREDEIRIADAKIAGEEAQVCRARAMLRQTELRSPIAGTVLHVNSEVGEYVGPDAKEAILYVADTSQTRVRAFVEEFHALRVSPGQRAYVLADGAGDTKFWGTVVSCSPLMMPKSQFSNRPDERVDVEVREIVILLDQDNLLNGLVLGLRVEVFIELDAHNTEPLGSTLNSR